MFLLIEQDVDEANEEQKELFVEAFGDKEKFFNVCVNEIEKAEEIIDLFRDNQDIQDTEADVASHEVDQYIPESQEDKLYALLDLFKGKDLVTLTKYIKIFSQGNQKVIGVAHAKLNNDFNGIYKKMKIKSDDEETKHVKSFTHPNSLEMSGVGSMKATSCKIFAFSKFQKTFREKILNLFRKDVNEDDLEFSDEADGSSSQDYPMYSQSRSQNTLKVCSCCPFRCRDQIDYDVHLEEHSKCGLCGLIFKDERELAEHHKNFHEKVKCTTCSKEVLEINIEKHMRGHLIEKGYSSTFGSKSNPFSDTVLISVPPELNTLMSLCFFYLDPL